MSRIVIVTLIYHCHQPIELILRHTTNNFTGDVLILVFLEMLYLVVYSADTRILHRCSIPCLEGRQLQLYCEGLTS
jgi:hypothetical protein